MAKMDRWEKYWLLAFAITLVIVFLLVFVLVPGFQDFMLSLFWYDRRAVIFFISLIVLGPFLLGYIIILLIKRRK